MRPDGEWSIEDYVQQLPDGETAVNNETFSKEVSLNLFKDYDVNRSAGYPNRVN